MQNVQAITKGRIYFLAALQGMWIQFPETPAPVVEAQTLTTGSPGSPRKCKILIKDVGTNYSGKKIKLEIIVQKN